MNTKFTHKAAILLMFLFSTVALKVNAQSWNLMDSTFSQSLNDFDFFDDNTGILTSGYSTYVTTNGALSWGPGVVSNYSVNTLKFLGDNSTVFSGTDNGTIWKSVDRGSNWTAVAPNVLGDVRGLTFNGSNGIAVDNYCNIAWSDNSGATWTKVPNSALCGNLSTLNKIVMPTALVAYAGGANGYLFKSVDGGKNWTQITTLPADFNTVKGLSFVDAQTGFIAGSFNTSNNDSLFKTTDGGATWTPATAGLSQLSEIFAVNANLVFAGAGDNKIYKSTDGGSNWTIDFTHPTCGQCGVKEFDLGSTTLYAMFGAGGSHKKIAKLANVVSGLVEAEAHTQVHIFPNPNNGKFAISKDADIKGVEIYNLMGEKVLELQNENNFDLSASPKGIYFAKIYGKAYTYSEKIVVQ